MTRKKVYDKFFFFFKDEARVWTVKPKSIQKLNSNVPACPHVTNLVAIVILHAKLSCDQISHGIMGNKIYMQPLRQDRHRMETNTPASVPGPGPKVISLAKLSCNQILRGIMGDKIHTQPLRQDRHRMGMEIAQRLECQTRNQKVVGLNLSRSGRKIYSPGSTFCVDSYFSICSTSVLLQ